MTPNILPVGIASSDWNQEPVSESLLYLDTMWTLCLNAPPVSGSTPPFAEEVKLTELHSNSPQLCNKQRKEGRSAPAEVAHVNVRTQHTTCYKDIGI